MNYNCKSHKFFPHNYNFYFSEWFVCFFAFISSFTHLILFGDPVTALMLWQISIIRRNLLLLLTLQIFLGILLSKFESHSFAIIFAIFSSFFYSVNIFIIFFIQISNRNWLNITYVSKINNETGDSSFLIGFILACSIICYRNRFSLKLIWLWFFLKNSS